MSDYQIDLGDGRSIVVNAGSPAEARSAAQSFLMREKGDARGKSGGVDNFVRSLAQGASFGLGDEVAAFGDATVGPTVDWTLDKLGLGKTNTSTAPTWSERYSQNLEAERAQNKRYESDHPVADLTGKVAGGAGTAVAALPAFLTSAPTLVRAGLAGAGLGALGGFGDGEGGLEERLKSAGKGSALGGVLGAGAYPVGKVAGTVGNMIAESGPGRYVADKVVAPGMRAAADVLDWMAPKRTPASLSAAAPDDGGLPSGFLADTADAFRSNAPTSTNILQDAADRRLASTLQRSNTDPAAVRQSMDELGAGAMIADTDPMASRLARTAYISPGSAPRIINEAMEARNRATGTRFKASMGDNAEVPSVYDAQRYLAANKREVGSRYYQGDEGGVAAADEKIAAARDALDRAAPSWMPAARVVAEDARGAMAAARAERDELGGMVGAGLKQPPELMALYENPYVKQAIDTVMSVEKNSRIGRPDARPASPVEIMHKVKQVIWDMGFDGATARPGPNASYYRDLGVDFVNKLKRANPKLAEADRAYSEAASLPEWLERGHNFMRSGTSEGAIEASPSALADMLPGAMPSQTMAFRVGSANAMKDLSSQGPDVTRRLAKNIDQNELLRQKLGEIFGDDAAGQMMGRSRAELKFAGTDRTIRGGSDTAGKLLSALDEAAGGHVPTTAHGMASRVIGKMVEAYNRGRAGNEEVRAQIARMLTSTDAELNADTLDRIARAIAAQGRPRALRTGAIIGIGQE